MGSSLSFLYNLECDGFHSCQRLIAGLGYVRWRQKKTIAAAVLQLKREGVLDSQVVGPVIRAAGSQIWSSKRKLWFQMQSKGSKFCFELQLTNCLRPRAIAINVSVISSDFLCSFLHHLELYKRQCIDIHRGRQPNNLCCERLPPQLTRNYCSNVESDHSPGHCGFLLPAKCRSMGRAASGSRSGWRCRAAQSPCGGAGSRPRHHSPAPTQGRSRSRSQCRGHSRRPQLKERGFAAVRYT